MNSVSRFILKYKILHLAYWVWAFMGLLHQRQQLLNSGLEESLPDAIIIICSQMICVYACIYFLIPRFLNKGRHLLFTGLAILFIISTALLSSVAQNFYTLFTIGEPLNNFFFITFTQSIDLTVVTAIFVALVVITQRYQLDQHKKQLEKEKLETELSFLKSQINPHFLFNALNSIYVLIDLDKKIASETLLRFSGLLRYQLYECSENEVDIDREILFLNDYIWLEKMRNGDLIEVDVQLDIAGRFRIAPFMLIPFFENAFKHVSRHSEQKNCISIKGIAENDMFSMTATNTYNKSEGMNGKSGIGLQNVARRLELLYPGRHELEIIKNEDTFTVKLKIHAQQNGMHYSR